MHVFHIRGFSGILMVLLALLAAVVLLLLLPASFMMVLWNAVVFEGFHGPEVDLYQGFLMWGIVMVLIKLVFRPELKLEFQRMPKPNKSAVKPTTLKAPNAEQSEEQVAPTVVEDATAANPQRDN